ncbi:hypothetical protein EDC01DRAFT_659229 [Geopyxis carbonaria]|nr:hypothetical protein EDC01DRAFT_659229 [Geopyxis carbonaria]
MGSQKKSKPVPSIPVVPTKTFDPTLASLFESSFGEVKVPAKPVNISQKRAIANIGGDIKQKEIHAEYDTSELTSLSSETPIESGEFRRSRKRKGLHDNDGLEGTYMQKLQDDDARQDSKKARSSKNKENKNSSDEDSDSETIDENKSEFPIKHLSLVNPEEEALNKSARTVFLGNVPSNAISSKTDYKTLKKFFSQVGKVSSVRFRSVAFSEQIPRKAAFVNHKLHEKQKTVNAYLVYEDVAAAREALKLNGSVVLSRHIRVDSVAHPGKHEPKRCVFVGNLDFEAQEENLWKHFLTCGKVESVRVIRDAKTNVGKGFAYVQFEDAMVVEQALLLDGKKMEGDRKLRVTRAKSIKRNQSTRNLNERPMSRKTEHSAVYIPKVDPKQQATIGRASKLLGRAASAQLKRNAGVFEGFRTTSTMDPGIKKRGAGSGAKKGKPRARPNARSSAWKHKTTSK